MDRHGGLIPWDDDLDICLLEEDEALLESLQSKFSEAGYRLERGQSYLWKIFHETDSDEVTCSAFSHRFPFCDVFLMARRQDGIVTIRDQTGRNAWPQEFYTPAQLKGVTLRQFGDFLLPCPGDPEEYLDREYGPSWPDTGLTHFFCHRSAGLMRADEFELTSGQMLPATPFF